MITIEIKRFTKTKVALRENLLTKRTPTDKQKIGYGGRDEPMYEEEYAVGETERAELLTVTLLEQQIEDEAAFDLGAVIKAINKLA